jgi:hypothetical protein
VDAWLYALEEDVLAEHPKSGGLGEPELAARVDDLLEQRLAKISPVAPSFSAALRAYRQAAAAGDPSVADRLIAWLGGQPGVGRAIKTAAGITGHLDHEGALGFLEGLLTVLRDSGYAGLVVVLDEVETLQRMRSDSVTGHGVSGTSLQQSAHLTQMGQLLGVISAAGLLGLVGISLARVGNFLRLPYQRCLFLHRLTGPPALLAVFVMLGGVGMAAYAYDELVRRRTAPRAAYAVSRIDRPAPDVIDVTLAPAGPAPLPLTGGQFVYLRAGSHPWREHPFSVAGAYADGSVRLTIRALGRGTRKLYNDLRERLPATLCGPYGMFDYTLGGPRQIWIAGGIGIAPFLGWLTSPASAPPRTDLFYSAPDAGEAPFVPELAAAAERQPGLRFHP